MKINVIITLFTFLECAVVAIGFDKLLRKPSIWNTSDTVVENHHIMRSLDENHLLNFIEQNVHSIFKNKVMVFIGDSLTRYQYLDLVTFFHRKQWISGDGLPALENEHDGWETWNNFLASSSARLGCQEICDCYRAESKIGSHAAGTYTARENRHFYDFGWNISIHSFLWLCGLPIRVNYNPNRESFKQLCSNSTFGDNLKRELFSPPAYAEYHTLLLDFLKQFIQPLKPDYLIINQGLWQCPKFREQKHLTVFSRLASSVASHAIWKTTTTISGERRSEKGFDPSHYEDSTSFLETLVRNGMRLYDAGMLTASLESEPNVFWDKAFHFQPFVYREMNKQLLIDLYQLG